MTILKKFLEPPLYIFHSFDRNIISEKLNILLRNPSMDLFITTIKDKCSLYIYLRRDIVLMNFKGGLVCLYKFMTYYICYSISFWVYFYFYFLVWSVIQFQSYVIEISTIVFIYIIFYLLTSTFHSIMLISNYITF